MSLLAYSEGLINIDVTVGIQHGTDPHLCQWWNTFHLSVLKYIKLFDLSLKITYFYCYEYSAMLKLIRIPISYGLHY